jgi:hypothetical protein
MLLLPSSGGRFTDEVTDIFTTAWPLRFAASRHLVGHAGEQAISAPVTATQALFWRTCAVARGNPFLGTSTVRASKAGFDPAFSSGRSIRHLHHQRRLSRTAHECATGKPEFSAARDAPRYCGLLEVRSVIGVRLIASFPPTGPARSDTRVSARAPGSGSPVPAFAGKLFRSAVPRVRTTKNPPERLGSGGFASERTGRSPSNEIASTSQARAIDRRKAER